MISVDILRAMNEAMVKLARPSGQRGPYTPAGQVRRDSFKGDPGKAPGMPKGSKPVNVPPPAKSPTPASSVGGAAAAVAKATPKPPALNPRTHFSTGQRKFKMPKGYKAPDSLVGKGFKERAMYIQSKGLNPFKRTGQGGWQRNKEVAGMMNAWYKDFKNPSKPASAPTPAPKAKDPLLEDVRNNPAKRFVTSAETKPAPKPASTPAPKPAPKPTPTVGDSAKSPVSGAKGTLRSLGTGQLDSARSWNRRYMGSPSLGELMSNADRASIYTRNNMGRQFMRGQPFRFGQPTGNSRLMNILFPSTQPQRQRRPLQLNTPPRITNMGDFRTTPIDQLQILRGANPARNPGGTGGLLPFYLGSGQP